MPLGFDRVAQWRHDAPALRVRVGFVSTAEQPSNGDEAVEPDVPVVERHFAVVRRADFGAGDGRPERLGPTVSVVIPAKNEAQNLPHVLAGLPHGLHELILVDGDSTDGTVEVALEHRPEIIVIGQTRRGKGNALACGFARATGDFIVMLDADGSTDPAEIPRFVDALRQGADFAKGSRFMPGAGSSDISRMRQAGNYWLNRIVNLLYGTRYTDLCYGYNAFWRHCLPAMSIDCAGFEVETLINIRIARAGLVITEVPSFEAERMHGQSNLRTFRDGARVLRTIFRERLRWTPHCHDVDAANERFAAPVVEAGLAGTAAE